MAMTNAKVNYNFEESYVNLLQMLVTNDLGRTIEHLELVHLGGYFGEVCEFDDIANGATGMININHKRKIYTTQINTTDTFVVGGEVYFVPGGAAAAGVLRSGYQIDAYPVGICTEIQAGVAIEFIPYAQQLGGNNSLKCSVYDVDSDAKTAAIVVTGLVPVGAKIVDVIIECTAANAAGTLQLLSNNATPAAITDAIVCAVDNTITRVGTLTNDVVDGDGLQILANDAADRGIMTIIWR